MGVLGFLGPSDPQPNVDDVQRDVMELTAEVTVDIAGAASQLPVSNLGATVSSDLGQLPKIQMVQTAPGANNRSFMAEFPMTNRDPNSDPYASLPGEPPAGIWSRIHILEALVSIQDASNPTATTLLGVGLGEPNTAANFPGAGALGHCYLMARMDVPQWQIHLGKTGAASLVTPLVGVPVPQLGFVRVRLIYNPIAGYVLGIVNGIIGAKVTDASRFPDGRSATAGGFANGLYMQSGSNAAASVAITTISQRRISIGKN